MRHELKRDGKEGNSLATIKFFGVIIENSGPGL